MSLDNTVKLIQANIQAAKDHLALISAAMETLKISGMYPAIPHFQWQRREEAGEARYLYLVFRQNGDGAYQGPDGKKKIYIGADPTKIEEAKRLTRNRQTWEKLKEHHNRLSSYITLCEGKLLQLESQADTTLHYSQQWPRSELSQIGAAPSGIAAEHKI